MALAGSYLDVTEFAARSIAPSALVNGDFYDPTGEWTDPVKTAARAAWVTFVQAQLIIHTSKINARLRKRYAVPFVDPVPELVRGWLATVVTPILYRKRGSDPSDEQIVTVEKLAEEALGEMKEAADSNEGLFDLPLIQSAATSDSAVTQGGPYSYSEASPYDWTDVQREAVRR